MTIDDAQIVIKMIIQSGVVHSNLILRKWMVKGKNVTHQCSACHKAFDAKVRLARMRNIRISLCELEFFCVYLWSGLIGWHI